MSTNPSSYTPERQLDNVDPRPAATETKPSFKTTELVVYVLSVLGVLIASLVTDVNGDGQGFSAYQGWFLVTLLTIGYLISRGLAKSGSRHHDARHHDA